MTKSFVERVGKKPPIVRNESFRGQTIKEAGRYDNCDFSHATFECDLTKAIFKDCNLYDTNWTKANNIHKAEFIVVANRDPFKAKKPNGEPIMKLSEEQLQTYGKWMGR